MHLKMNKFKKVDVPKRRGRPKKCEILKEINASKKHLKGQVIKGWLYCTFCSRSFPRIKSLRSHIMTHTGVKPYLCTYPSCERSFIQSGQLKTHYKFHTREKDYVCPIEGCNTRFAHQGRKCKYHPDMKLRKDGKVEINYNENHTPLQRAWLDSYKRNKSLPAKHKKSSFIYGKNSAGAANIIPGKSSEHASVSLKQYRTFCNGKNTRKMGNNPLQKSSSLTKDNSAKYRKTLRISSMSSAIPDISPSEISDRSDTAELSTRMSEILNQHPDWQYGVSQNIHSVIVPQYYRQNLQKTESTGLFDKSLADSLSVQEVIFNSCSKPIHTPVIQFTQCSTNIQTPSPDVINAAMALLSLKHVR